MNFESCNLCYTVKLEMKSDCCVITNSRRNMSLEPSGLSVTRTHDK
jgi:hypothetical protein